jgi:O-antigen ligase/tetratricopeptide (TPR) repeat protein
MGEAAVQTYGHSRPRLAELGLVVLLVYHTFIGGAAMGQYYFYPRLISQALLMGLLLVWLVCLWWRRLPWPVTPIDRALLALGGVMIVSTALAREPGLSLQQFPLYLSYVLIFYLVVERLRAGWSPVMFAKALMMTASVVCLFALFETAAWYLGLGIFPGFEQGWVTIGGLSQPLPPYWHRLEFTLNNPNIVAAFLACTLPLGLVAALTRQSRWQRASLILWLVMATAVLLLTFSRGGLLAALAGVVALASLLVRRRQPSGFGKLTGRSVLLAGLGLALLLVPFLGGLLTILHRPGSDDARLTIWQYALMMVRDRPLFGSGAGSLGGQLMEYWDATRHPIEQALLASVHNVPLHAAVVLGIPGMLLVAAIGALVLAAGHRVVRRLPDEQAIWQAGFLAGLMAFAVHSMFEMLLFLPSATVPVIILAAVCSAGGRGHTLLPRRSPPLRGLVLTAAMALLGGLFIHGLGSLNAAAVEAGQGRWDVAAQRLSQLPPGSLPASFRTFQLALIRGHQAQLEPSDWASDEAVGSYLSGLQTQPAYVPGRANLAALYWQRGELDLARQELQRMVRQIPDQPLYWLNLGLLEEQARHLETATQAYARAIAADTGVAASLFWRQTKFRQQAWADIVGLARREIERSDDVAARSLRLGQLAYYLGDWSGSVAIFRARAAAGDAEALRWLLRALLAEGQAAVALEAWESLASNVSDARVPEVHRCRGQVYLADGHLELARRELQTALFLKDRDAHADLARLSELGGEWEAAAAHYRALARPPADLALFHQRLDFVFYRSGSILDANLLPVAFVPPSAGEAGWYLALANSLARSGDVAAAGQACRDLLRLVPAYPPATDCLQRWTHSGS